MFRFLFTNKLWFQRVIPCRSPLQIPKTVRIHGIFSYEMGESSHTLKYLTNTFRAGRSACQQGFFLRGVYRSNGNSLGHIEWGKCCKPSHHPYHWGDCYNEDVSGTFNKAGLSECRRDEYFIAGFETTSGGALSSIKKFKCCRMVEGKWGWKKNLFF